MAYDTRELKIKIVGDTSDLNKTLESGNTSLGKMSAAIGAISGVVQNVFSRAVNGITSTLGDAVNRVDTLNNATNTFQNMGFASKDTQKAMNSLKDSILGLPTPLDQAISGVELLAGATGDIGKSQKIFSAMNDAIIGFGGSASDVKGAVVQLSQAFSNGKIDAGTWNSLIQNGMGPALNAIAKQMGITTAALKNGLSDGTVSVQSFQDALVKMDTDGGGGMKSFQKTAKDATSGIGTGMENARTAIVRGIADIIQSVGSKNISNAITTMGKVFENALKDISTAIIDTINFIKKYQGILTPLAIVIGAITTTFLVWTAAIQAWTIATNIAKTAQLAYNAVIAANPIMLIVMAISAVIAALVYLQVKFNIFGEAWNFIKSVWSGAVDFFSGIFDGIKNVILGVIDWISKNWSLLLAIITGPIGIAASIIIKNFDTIKDAVGDVWNWIKGAFGTIGDIATAAIKGVVNGVLGFAEKTINGFISIVNGAISVLNKIPGVNISKVSDVNLPRLAAGGIVPATPGGRLAVIGEGGQDEAVIPLNKLDSILQNTRRNMNSSGGSSITLNFNVGMYAGMPVEKRAIAEDLWRELVRSAKAQGVILPSIGSVVVQ